MLNIEDSIAVTQNFCNSSNFDRVWMHTKRSRPRMATKWLARLRQVRLPTKARVRGYARPGAVELLRFCSNGPVQSCPRLGAAPPE